MQCSKAFIIQVSVPPPQNCPDWDAYVWGTEITTGFLGAVAAGQFVNPKSQFPAGSFVSAQSNAIGSLGSISTIYNTALAPGLPYNGTACAQTLRVFISGRTGAAAQTGGFAQLELQPDNIILAIYSDFDQPMGTYDTPFVIPDTGGQTKYLLLSAYCECGQGGIVGQNGLAFFFSIVI